MLSSQSNDYSLDTGTMPGVFRRNHGSGTQTLNRQPSRHFDGGFGGGHQADGVYGENGLASRFDQGHGQRFDGMPPPGQQNGYNNYDMGMPQAWNNSNYNHLAALGATTRLKQQASRGRPGLPNVSTLQQLAHRLFPDLNTSQGWMDQNSPMPSTNGFSNLGSSNMGPPNMRNDHLNSDDEDLIPTAIVIKNIPFAVKKEQLVQVMTDMRLPLPYAFNYHFDNGVFRGLAFANFTTPEETAAVINSMNHLDLHGRKLRVEYKKMLPQAERDRIEREKRERRGQLEEQHRPMPSSQLHTRQSMSNLSNYTRGISPAPTRSPPAGRKFQIAPADEKKLTSRPAVDMNDPVALMYYGKLLLFSQNESHGDVLTFPPNIPSEHRKIIHGLAHNIGLGHESQGIGEQRQVHCFRTPGGLSPPNSSGQPHESDRRGLYRTSTQDFSDSKDPAFFGPLGRQSSGYLGYADSQSVNLNPGNREVRVAKSMADLRSYAPSPSTGSSGATITGGFPSGLASNAARYAAEYNAQTSPNQRNNGPSTAAPLRSNDPDSILNGLGNLNLNAPPSGFGARAPSPQRLRPMMSWDHGEIPGPIGGHRSMSANQGDLRNGVNGRQARTPMTGGFGRACRREDQSSRGSDEHSHQNGILESVDDE